MSIFGPEERLSSITARAGTIRLPGYLVCLKYDIRFLTNGQNPGNISDCPMAANLSLWPEP